MLFRVFEHEGGWELLECLRVLRLAQFQGGMPAGLWRDNELLYALLSFAWPDDSSFGWTLWSDPESHLLRPKLLRFGRCSGQTDSFQATLILHFFAWTRLSHRLPHKRVFSVECHLERKGIQFLILTLYIDTFLYLNHSQFKPRLNLMRFYSSTVTTPWQVQPSPNHTVGEVGNVTSPCFSMLQTENLLQKLVLLGLYISIVSSHFWTVSNPLLNILIHLSMLPHHTPPYPSITILIRSHDHPFLPSSSSIQSLLSLCFVHPPPSELVFWDCMRSFLKPRQHSLCSSG